MVKNKHVVAIDFVIIAATLVFALVLVGYARPLIIAPVDELITTNSSVLFEFEKGDFILLDNNLDFSSPEKIYAEDNLIINLKPGVYYWRVQGALTSEIRQLTIQSEVELKLKEFADGKFKIVNAGNTNLNVDVYENGELNQTLTLGVEEEKEVSGKKFIAREDVSGGENE
ncbi:hypothetical protein HY450_02440 [Candidatus Pacearchaeota archaeon]|nr:hypothetical protein [Candidatus Pacearchaeota archaeon]